MVGDSTVAAGGGSRRGFFSPIRALPGPFRRWTLWTLPRRGLICYLVGVEMVAFAATVAAFVRLPPTRSALLPFVVLAVGMLVSAELSRPLERVHSDGDTAAGLDAIWLFAGVLLLPPGLSAGLILLSFLYRGLRLRRRVPHRQVFGAAVAVVAGLAAFAVLEATGIHPLIGAIRDARTFFLIVLAGVAFLACTTVLSTGAVSGGAPGSSLRAALGAPAWYAYDAVALALGVMLAWMLADWPLAALLVLGVIPVLQQGGLVRGQREQTRIDPGTGLLTACSWTRAAQADLERAPGRGAGLLMLDLDHFERINERHGRRVGDEVLRAVADTLRAEVRSADLVGRLGGDEFVVLLPGSSRFDAMAIAERIRLRVASTAVALRPRADGSQFAGSTVSIGVAARPGDGTTVEKLLEAAEYALRLAEQAGRNRTVSADAVEL